MNHEAVNLLSEYLRIDTTNPPGRENLAAGFFGKIFDQENIAYKTYEPEPGRVSLRAVLPGTGDKKPLILLNHSDVVPAKAEEWSFDPFGGLVKDGFVHGRGALDMKGQGIMELVAFLNLKRAGLKLNRDVIFLTVADEETGGRLGAQYLLENHAEDFQAGLVLNEGGFVLNGLLPGRQVVMISSAEKGMCQLKLTRPGPPGHASLPHGQNALEKLNAALTRLLTRETTPVITAPVAEYFTNLAAGLDFLEPYAKDPRPEVLAGILKTSGLLGLPEISGIVQNTISLTVMQAGDKINVIPSLAEAQLDCRLLPGHSAEWFISEVKTALADPEIQVYPLTISEATESPRDDNYRLLAEVAAQSYPNAIVTPSLLFASSDSRFFRKMGIPTFGFCPLRLCMGDIKMVHGIDEKISAEELINGSKVYGEVLRRFCVS